jgi:SAM-dependent methyltransferase
MSKRLTWHENDEFWESVAPAIFGERAWASAVEQIDQVVALLSLTPGAAILDMCCGQGRHALQLARLGFHVTGVDRTASYIEEASVRAEAERLPVEFVHGDMRHFCRPGTFDAAIVMFTSFGYFEDPAENLRVAQNLCRSLKDGGSLLVDTAGKEAIALRFQERDWQEQEGILLLQERRVIDDWARMENRWIAIEGSKRREFTTTHWVYSAVEFSALLKEAGFASVSVYGDLNGAPYDHTARRLIAVGRK